jgi:hypothetical protein
MAKTKLNKEELVKSSFSEFGLSSNKKSNTENKSNTGKPGKTVRKKRTFPIDTGILETLERASYWDRTDQNKIIEEALKKYFFGKEYPEIPNK